jgi:hypothetical protein
MAEPRYRVTITFSMGPYVGAWAGDEPEMEEQSTTILCESPSKEYAESLTS